jgi:hypothetical protein
VTLIPGLPELFPQAFFIDLSDAGFRYRVNLLDGLWHPSATSWAGWFSANDVWLLDGDDFLFQQFSAAAQATTAEPGVPCCTGFC